MTGPPIILLFWFRSSIHTLTVIRWPLEFGHNFLYIACTLVETVTFTQLTQPLRWYALNALFGVTIWAVFALDLRMIRRRMRDSAGPTGQPVVCHGAARKQGVNVKVWMPATVVFNLLAAVAVYRWPGALIGTRAAM